MRDAAEAARAAPPGPRPPRAIDLLLDGLATRFTEGYAAGVPPLRRALHAFWREDRSQRGRHALALAGVAVAPEPSRPISGTTRRGIELTARAVTLARDAGALTVLPVALTYRAGVHVHAGEFAAAAALIEEADAITEATGNAPLAYTVAAARRLARARRPRRRS